MLELAVVVVGTVEGQYAMEYGSIGNAKSAISH